MLATDGSALRIMKASLVGFPSFIVLAAVWNEEAFLPHWLSQLEDIAPDEVLLSEGCFDSSLPRESTDDSRTILTSWTQGQPRAQLFDVVRQGRPRHILSLIGAIQQKGAVAHGVSANSIRDWARSTYRINQSATFTALLGHSRTLAPGSWIMTLDVDEFFPEQTLEMLRMRTFLKYGTCMPMFERRFVAPDTEIALPPEASLRTHNIPIRIPVRGARFATTRHVISTRGLKSVPLCSRDVALQPLADFPVFFHYQTRNDRRRLALSLGDRKQGQSFPTMKRPVEHPPHSPFR